MLAIILISLFLTGLDQIIKIVIDHKLIVGKSIEIIPKFFNITNTRNYGAAWSILKDQAILLAIIGIVAIIIIYFNLIKDKNLKKFDIILISMLIAGIMGNLIDRVRLGYVIDYLDFNIFGYDYPVFNFADILIVISMIALIIKSIKEEKNAKNNRDWRWKRYPHW